MRAARIVLAGAFLGFPFAASADEAAVRRMVEDKLRGAAKLESVRKAPWAGLYEVVVRGPDGPQIYYVDEAASVIITGQAIDAKTGRNLTEERSRELNKIEWSALPLHWAITSKRGSGRRKIAILSDPNCPYCKRLEEDLAKLGDITVHILPYAVLGPKSEQQAKSVWCSKDRVKAWNELMFRRIEPQASPDCDNPIERLAQFGRGIGANSTPTWFLANGERYSGAVPLEEVRALLDRASPAKK
ncbi:MAG: DsbC family protein [Betaproteobacteria bacterium]